MIKRPPLSPPCYPYKWTAGESGYLVRLLKGTALSYSEIAKAINKEYGTAYNKNSVAGHVRQLRKDGILPERMDKK